MKVDHHIFAVVEPAIRPKEVKVEALGEEDGADRQTKSFARLEPYITINPYQFLTSDVSYFKLSLSDKVPSFQAVVRDSKKLFDSEFYPRDGDLATVFLNSPNSDTFKSIHMDFELTSVEMIKETQFDVPELIISGVAKIPNISAEVCKYYEDGTSIEHLELIARDLKLGLATNVSETQDKQARIQAWIDSIDFIDDVVSSSFVSENSFTTWYIDQFYYLNYVDINRIFDSPNPPPGELQANYTALKQSIAESASKEEDADNLPAPLMLSNELNFRTSNMYIHEYRLQNNSADVSRVNGYSRKVAFYDDNADKGSRHAELNIQPFVSKSMPDSDRPLRGSIAAKEDLTVTEVKHKWMGRQNAGEDGLGNVHPHALYSMLIDHQNQEEVQKMKLYVKLAAFNPSLYKYQKIPVMIYEIDPHTTKTRAAFKEAAKEVGALNETLVKKDSELKVTSEENPDQVQNHFLSGYYIIENIDYVFDEDIMKMVQELTLIRREWPGKAADLTAAKRNKE
jgi:hypothetical protein